jgi:hypothetical protein
MDYHSDIKQTIPEILEQAKMETKADWWIYERYKKRLRQAAKTAEEYSEAVINLVDILVI